MKISRFKKCNKILNYYCNNFNYRAPFQILIDATFCYVALQNKVSIEDQLRKYLQQEIKLLTTQCIIIESESLGPKLIGATKIVKKFHVHKCGHEGNPVTGSSCILSMIKCSRYIVATQDRKLQNILRKRPGQPLLYLHSATPVLDSLSDSTKKAVAEKMKSISVDSVNNINLLRKLEGIPDDTKNEKVKFKRKPKNPNPLSCKKKKKKAGCTAVNEEGKITKEKKRKRKKIIIPINVRETLENKN